MKSISWKRVWNKIFLVISMAALVGLLTNAEDLRPIENSLFHHPSFELHSPPHSQSNDKGFKNDSISSRKACLDTSQYPNWGNNLRGKDSPLCRI